MKNGSKKYVLCIVMGSFLKMYGAEKPLSVSFSSLSIPSLESSVHSSHTPSSGIPSPQDAERNTELLTWWSLITKYENLAHATSDPKLKAYYKRMAQNIRDLFASSGASGLTPDEIDLE